MKFQTDVDLSDQTINAQILQQVILFLCLSLALKKEIQKIVFLYMSFIPPQLSALVASQGLAEIKLQWKVQPKK